MTETLNYEQARDELLQVVHKLESGGISLQESIELWERGEELAMTCQRWLDGARARFDAAVPKDGQREDQAVSNEEDQAVSNESVAKSAPPD